MATIKTTCGKEILIDDADLPLVGGVNWYAKKKSNTHYAERKIKTDTGWSNVLMHRVILDARKGQVIDHVNGNGLDNRKENLRIVSIGQNAMNRRKILGTTSKYKGVVRRVRGWCAQIEVHGYRLNLGTFGVEEDAARAYDRAAVKFFGEHARLNFWGAPEAGGMTPGPGGLDRLGVVKELKEIRDCVDRCPQYQGFDTQNGYLNEALDRLQQLISRLEGQGTEEPAVSEPEGQCGDDGHCTVCGEPGRSRSREGERRCYICKHK